MIGTILDMRHAKGSQGKNTLCVIMLGQFFRDTQGVGSVDKKLHASEMPFPEP